MVDWTIIATTAIATTSGLVGAALGFPGARMQATSEAGEVRSIAIRDRSTGKTLIKRSRSARPPRVQILSPTPKA